MVFIFQKLYRTILCVEFGFRDSVWVVIRCRKYQHEIIHKYFIIIHKHYGEHNESVLKGEWAHSRAIQWLDGIDKRTTLFGAHISYSTQFEAAGRTGS